MGNSKWVTKTELNIWGQEEMVTSRKKSGSDYVHDGINTVGGYLVLAGMISNWRKNSAVDALMRKLEKAREYGDYAAQVRVTSEMIDRFGAELPDIEVAYMLRASAHYSLDSLDAAIADAQSAIRINDAYVDGYVSLGDLLATKGEWAAAIKAYTEAIRRDQVNSAALSGRADMLSEVGNHTAALLDADRLVVQEPGDEYFVWQRSKIRLAGGDTAGALTDLGMAIKLAPKEPIPYRTRAKIYRSLGDDDKAWMDEETARQLDDVRIEVAKATALCCSRDMFAVLQPFCNIPTNSADARKLLPDVTPYMEEDELLGAAICVSPPFTRSLTSASWLLGFRTCILAVTDRRLLFVGDDLRKKRLNSDYYPLTIQTIRSHQNRSVNDRLELVCDSGTVQFDVAVASKGKADQFVDLVMRWLVQHRSVVAQAD